MMYTYVSFGVQLYRYRKIYTYHFLGNKYFPWLFEPDSKSGSKYFGMIIESIHMYHLGSQTECPGGKFKI